MQEKYIYYTLIDETWKFNKYLRIITGSQFSATHLPCSFELCPECSPFAMRLISLLRSPTMLSRWVWRRGVLCSPHTCSMGSQTGTPEPKHTKPSCQIILDFPSLPGPSRALQKLSLLISVTFHLSQALALDNLGFLCLLASEKVFKVNYKASRE